MYILFWYEYLKNLSCSFLSYASYVNVTILIYRCFQSVASDGKMDPTHFIAMFVALHDQVDNPYLIKFLARLYLVFDTDGSGYIVFQEFILVWNLLCSGSGQ